MRSLPPSAFDSRLPRIGPIDSLTLAGWVDFAKSVMTLHDFFTCSAVMARPSLKSLPSVRSQRSLAKSPPPTSKRPPVSSQLSCASQATSGETYSGLSASVMFFGRIVSVRREPAIGAIVLTWTFFFFPSRARVFEKPTRPSFAIA